MTFGYAWLKGIYTDTTSIRYNKAGTGISCAKQSPRREKQIPVLKNKAFKHFKAERVYSFRFRAKGVCHGILWVFVLILLALQPSGRCLGQSSFRSSYAKSKRRLARAISEIEMKLPEDRSLITAAATPGQLLETNTRRIFFIAKTRRRVGSVRFSLGSQTLNVENRSPYETYSLLLPDDEKTLCAQAFSRADQKGVAGPLFCVFIKHNPRSTTLPGRSPSPLQNQLQGISNPVPRTSYGSSLYATNNANEPIKDTNLTVEFESPVSGTLLAFQTYFMYKYDRPGAYHNGDGGTYRISLYEVENDGSFSSGRPLDVITYAPALRIFKGWSGKQKVNDVTNRSGENIRFKALNLKSAPLLQAGHRYAFLFENTHPQRNLNWLSLNGLAALDFPPPENHFLAPEFRGPLPASQGLIYRRAEKIINYNTPVFGLQYDLDGDGSIDFTFGGGYHEAGYLAGGASNHPDSRVTRFQRLREIFSPNTSILAKGIAVYAGECGEGGKLLYSLKTDLGTTLASGQFDTVVRARCSTIGLRAAYSSFPATVVLAPGTTYSLEFFTDTPSVFYIPFVRHGGTGSLSYIVGEGTRFQDGRGQVGTGVANIPVWRDIKNESMKYGGAPADYSFYFVTEPYIPAYESKQFVP